MLGTSHIVNWVKPTGVRICASRVLGVRVCGAGSYPNLTTTLVLEYEVLGSQQVRICGAGSQQVRDIYS